MSLIKHVITASMIAYALMLALPISAQNIDTIQLSLGTVAGNPGDTVEIPVTLNAGNTAPSTFILWVQYNAQQLTPNDAYYQFTQASIIPGGAPVVTTSFARPEAAVVNAGRLVETNIPQPGQLVVLVAGAPSATVADGLVLTLAFTIDPSVALGASITVEGLDADNAPPTLASSAADDSNSPQSIPVSVEDGLITIGCPPASNVTGVSATTDRIDGVLVSWNANLQSGVEYRVFRNTVNNADTATPLGSAWQSATSFLDLTALSPVVNDPGGCFRPPDFTPVAYFYWVLARSAVGCVSENFSTPSVQGSRTFDPKAKNGALTVENVLPAKRANASAMRAIPDSPLAIRLDAGAEPVASESVWGRASGEGWESASIAVTPANDQGAVWVSIAPDNSWTPGDHIIFEAGGASVDGAAIGPYVVEYVVESPEKNIVVLPILPEGVGDVFDILPDGVYSDAQTVALPVPAGYSPQDLYVYYYAYDAHGGAWVLAENVDGFLTQIEYDEASNSILATIRHSATLQLGVAPMPEPIVRSNAAMMPSTFTPGSLADAAMFLLVIALLAGLRFKPNHGKPMYR